MYRVIRNKLKHNIDEIFTQKNGKRGRAKRIKRDSKSFIIRVREIALFRKHPIRTMVQFYYFIINKTVICDAILYIILKI